jgi:hypothetical protein
MLIQGHPEYDVYFQTIRLLSDYFKDENDLQHEDINKYVKLIFKKLNYRDYDYQIMRDICFAFLKN